MKEKEIVEVAEDSFKRLDKLYHKIPDEFDADDIHDFRVEVKKLRAFLRLIDIKDDDEPIISKPLKVFYGYTGSLRNIHLLKHSLFKYVTKHLIEKPESYIQLLDEEENCRKKDIREFMEANNFQDVKEKILKALPGKLNKLRIKKFIQNKLSDLKKLLEDFNDDDTMHSTRKILKDILYTWHYTEDDADLPKIISGEDELKSIAATLGDFMDKYIMLEFLQPSYLNKIKNEDEKLLLSGLQKKLNRKKLAIKKEAAYSLNSLKEQLDEMEL